MNNTRLHQPILFLIYNRPDITQRVFNEIRKAKPERLFVAADGPREGVDSDTENCLLARAIINQVDWNCELKTFFREKNIGCKNAVSSAITWFFQNIDAGIILEDDCLPSRSFFWFCQELLEYYMNDDRIMMISGMNYLKNQFSIEESYLFSRYFPVWGWATWKRAWGKYDITMNKWDKLKNEQHLKSFFPQEYMQTWFTSMFDMAYNNQLDTWDAQWVYSCLFNSGLCIIPRVNLISNIGVIGTHSKSSSEYHNLPLFTLDEDNLKHPDMLFPNFLYEKTFFENVFKSKNDSLNNRLTDKVKLKIKNLKDRIKDIKNKALNKKIEKPDPKNYSTTVGVGSIVPNQIEAYFLVLNKYINESEKILDVGFGLGYGLNILAIKASEVSGVDVDKKVYDYCQGTVVNRNPRLVHLSLYDGYCLNFPDNSFDVVTCVDVIEHVEDYDSLINEMLRVAKKGIFLSTPNRRPEYTNPDGTPKNYWHLREWSFKEFDEIIRKHGQADWNFLNGPFDGPFMHSSTLQEDTLTLSPFIYKKANG